MLTTPVDDVNGALRNRGLRLVLVPSHVNERGGSNATDGLAHPVETASELQADVSTRGDAHQYGAVGKWR
jgi:hypothetical protein